MEQSFLTIPIFTLHYLPQRISDLRLPHKTILPINLKFCQIVKEFPIYCCFEIQLCSFKVGKCCCANLSKKICLFISYFHLILIQFNFQLAFHKDILKRSIIFVNYSLLYFQFVWMIIVLVLFYCENVKEVLDQLIVIFQTTFLLIFSSVSQNVLLYSFSFHYFYKYKKNVGVSKQTLKRNQ